MSKIGAKFSELKEKGKKALITFVTAGDPDIKTTVEIVKEMEKQGADIIELGIPYSDPIAEGPVIQQANERALKHNIKIKDIMEAVKEIRKEVKVPILYLLYFNCILQYGPERFFEDCVNAGVDGLIVPDLPFEEKDEIGSVAEKYNLDIITLVSPTSNERIEQITKNAKGFLYCVSSLGVTGVRKDFDTDFDTFFSYIDKFTRIPTALGFGISTPEHIRKLKKYADGLIVGSAVVKQVERSTTPEEAVKNVGEFVRGLKAAMDE
ncbi:MAG: tryptophan synthase subunit alpha [Clostridia bacterium]|nr:tryptophan synthase subunit alpha [Clostridia bacterium]